MRQTVLGVYDSYVDACTAQRALGDAGVAQADIAVYSMSVAAVEKGPRVYTPGGGDVRHRKPVFDQLEQLFARLFKRGAYPPETEDYREWIRRGGALVSADVSEMQVDLARDVMCRAGAADIDERSSGWRNGSVKMGISGYAQSRAVPSPDGRTGVSTQTSRPGVVGDPIKEAPLASAPSEDEFRKDYEAHYAHTGMSYDEYRRACAHGAALAQDDRYRGHDWQLIEPSAREHWESHYPDSAWARFKAAVRHGWERVRGL